MNCAADQGEISSSLDLHYTCRSELTRFVAFLKALMTICGWTFSSMNGLDCLRNSPANNTTDVVPSPT